MIRERIVESLVSLAVSLGATANGSAWHLFGSIDREAAAASDIDLLILCINDAQADALRRQIDPDDFRLPLHLSLMTFEEAAGVDAVQFQKARRIYP